MMRGLSATPNPSFAAQRSAALLSVLVAAFALSCLPTSKAASLPATARCALADGFDFPVGKPNANGYRKARGFSPNGHLGEDWNGDGGGDSDLGDPIYSTARGIVILSENVHVGWGNCVIVRHAYREETGKIAMVDSLYGHLLARKVEVGQVVERGQLVGTMGSNNGMYPAHLHFEMRKNLHIGMNRSSFARDYSNYYSPTQFINARRQLVASFRKYEIPLRTFAAYGKSLSDIEMAAATRSLNIPVFAEEDAKPSKREAPKPEPSKPTPTTPTAEKSGDFWSRLRARLNKGKVTDSSGN
ncbi:MAG: M23 family metallopeptidase [Verrucomicrobiaceae bacterium]|nr:M23 family metallopeptidase [Verrucomicrobiaceae bacterium]